MSSPKEFVLWPQRATEHLHQNVSSWEKKEEKTQEAKALVSVDLQVTSKNLKNIKNSGCKDTTSKDSIDGKQGSLRSDGQIVPCFLDYYYVQRVHFTHCKMYICFVSTLNELYYVFFHYHIVAPAFDYNLVWCLTPIESRIWYNVQRKEIYQKKCVQSIMRRPIL